MIVIHGVWTSSTTESYIRMEVGRDWSLQEGHWEFSSGLLKGFLVDCFNELFMNVHELVLLVCRDGCYIQLPHSKPSIEMGEKRVGLL